MEESFVFNSKRNRQKSKAMGTEESRYPCSIRMPLSVRAGVYGSECEESRNRKHGHWPIRHMQPRKQSNKLRRQRASKDRHVLQLWARRRGREHRTRIRSTTVSSRFRIDLLKRNVNVKSRFAFTALLYILFLTGSRFATSSDGPFKNLQ